MTEDANTPIAEKAAHKKKAPKKPPTTGPISGEPNMKSGMTYSIVGATMAAAVKNAASHLPAATELSVTGSVMSVSIEPLRFSSANSRIVSAGIKNESKIGRSEK